MSGFYLPLRKIDEERRLVYGRAIHEVVDRTNEIIDYDTAKPAFEKWSKQFEDITGGLSKGNVRVMHDPKKVAGKLVELTFNDDEKAIDVVAKVVDDDAWKKCLAGVLTGFSVGGGYGRKWKDGATGATRYTPVVTEISLVDNPCIPSARIVELAKSDGTVEHIRLTGRARSFDEVFAARPRSFEEVLASSAAVPSGPRSFDEVMLAKAALPFGRKAGMRAMMAAARSARAGASEAVETSARRAGQAAYDRAAMTAARSETARLYGGNRQAGQRFRPSITAAHARQMADDAATAASDAVRRDSAQGIRAARVLGAMQGRDDFNARVRGAKRMAGAVGGGAAAGAAAYGAVGGYNAMKGRRALSEAEQRQREEAARSGAEKRRGRGDTKVASVMREFNDGRLRSGGPDGPIVTNRKQAVAIALSEARRGERRN